MATISKDLLNYLEKLSLHNEKERFHDPENQDRYQEKRKEFKVFVEEFRNWIADRCDPKIADVELKNMIFRINRDVRFSKDKSPYKNNFWASLTKEWWKKSPYAWWYLHLQPWNKSFVWWGLYGVPKDTMEVVRDKFERDGKLFDAIVSDKDFQKYYEVVRWNELKTYPRNRSVDAPNLKRVRKKARYAICEFKDSEVVQKGFMEKCLNAAEALTAMNEFLNDGVEDLFI